MSSDAVNHELLAFGKTISSERLFPTIIPAAASYVLRNPFAFALACSLDRGLRAEIVWNIPYDMMMMLGELDPLELAKSTPETLSSMVSRLPRKPRYINDGPRTIHELAVIVCDDYAGDASSIWTKRSASEVRHTFLRIHGVGLGIANMAVLLIEKAFGVRFPDIDHRAMDIKPDVHTIRVLFRLGMSKALTAEAAIESTRRMNPSFPGELDAPLWIVGREFCRATSPVCEHCPLNDQCQHLGIA